MVQYHRRRGNHSVLVLRIARRGPPPPGAASSGAGSSSVQSTMRPFASLATRTSTGAAPAAHIGTRSSASSGSSTSCSSSSSASILDTTEARARGMNSGTTAANRKHRAGPETMADEKRTQQRSNKRGPHDSAAAAASNTGPTAASQRNKNSRNQEDQTDSFLSRMSGEALARFAFRCVREHMTCKSIVLVSMHYKFSQHEKLNLSCSFILERKVVMHSCN